MEQNNQSMTVTSVFKSGEIPKIRILEEEEYHRCLEAKLDEEVAEFHADKNAEELADILEVVSRKASAMLSRPVRAVVHSEKLPPLPRFSARLLFEGSFFIYKNTNIGKIYDTISIYIFKSYSTAVNTVLSIIIK